MHNLVPATAQGCEPAELVAAEARTPGTSRPWVLANMVTSIDGAAWVQGRSGALGSPADKRLFRALRGAADVILVGAGTVTSEGYGTVVLDPASTAIRQEQGQSPSPRLAVVSRTLGFDPKHIVGDGERPLVITCSSAPVHQRKRLETGCELLIAGDADVDLTLALVLLRSLGYGVVLSEGGPTLLGSLLAADLVDEMRITVAPLAVAGPAGRIAHSSSEHLSAFRLDRVLAEGDHLFLRYLRNTRGTGSATAEDQPAEPEVLTGGA